MNRLLALLVALVVLLPAAAQARPCEDRPSVAARPSATKVVTNLSGKVPTKEQWLADVHRAMAGARKYVKQRAATGDERLAVNFDIDNTVLETYYGGGAIPEMLAFTQFAQRHGVGILFNTGRVAAQHDATLTQLSQAGYVVNGLCLRDQGEALAHGKQRCRAQFVADGWTIIENIENIGNRSTDLAGGDYEKKFKLPDYGGVLG